jgi:hypothetical protein
MFLMLRLFNLVPATTSTTLRLCPKPKNNFNSSVVPLKDSNTLNKAKGQ